MLKKSGPKVCHPVSQGAAAKTYHLWATLALKISIYITIYYIVKKSVKIC